MAVRKKAKPVVKRQTPKLRTEAPEAQVVEAGKAEPKPQAPARTEAKPTRRAPRAKPKKRRAAARRQPTPRPKHSRTRQRRRRTATEKARILTIAAAQGLTAKQVQAEFGVKPVTYYSWRKKAKRERRRGAQRVVRGRPRGVELAGLVRESVQERVQQMLPGIVRGEVAAYLNRAFRKPR
jgi:hypothetical protein